MAEFGEKFSLYEQLFHSRSYLLNTNLRISITRVTVHFSCQNSYLFQSYLKILVGHNVHSCCLLKFSKKHRLICHNIGLANVRMDSYNWVYILLLVLGEKMPVFYLGSKISCSRAQLLAKLQGLRL